MGDTPNSSQLNPFEIIEYLTEPKGQKKVTFNFIIFFVSLSLPSLLPYCGTAFWSVSKRTARGVFLSSKREQKSNKLLVFRLEAQALAKERRLLVFSQVIFHK